MHSTDPSSGRHDHAFGGDTAAAERRTYLVIVITAAMMVVEIAVGLASHSMALLADGWHMSTHVAAFLIAALAYYLSRRHARNPRFSFGTGKMGVLGGFVSAILLTLIAFFMAGESVHRMVSPLSIRFNEALLVAAVGLAVNLICALIFKDDGSPHPDHTHHAHAGHDLNRHAAYIHVLTDALTSVTAIVALIAGKCFGWVWLDPVMGLVGSVVVGVWAYGLLCSAGGILLDHLPDSSDLPDEIRAAVEGDGDSRVSDLHVWQVAAGQFAAIVSVVAHAPKTPETYRRMLGVHEELVHVTIEVQTCCADGVRSEKAVDPGR